MADVEIVDTTAPRWVDLGREGDYRYSVRVDQIACWEDHYSNGYQHYLTVTLVGGKEIKVEVTREQWDAFRQAVRG